MDKKHEIISKVKQLTSDLGRAPKKLELLQAGITSYSLDHEFGNYTNLMKAAGLSSPTSKEQFKLEKQYKKLCQTTEKIQGFFRHTLDLKEMFDRAGNPPVLKMSVQGDTHAKFVDEAALNSYIMFLRSWGPHAHLILGDFADCEGLSHWPSDSLEPRRIVPEMVLARKILERIVEATPKCSTRVFLTGNHESWIESALNDMPELFDGLAELGFEINMKSLLGLDKFGYDLFPLNHLVRIGKAHFTHGIYTAQHHAKKHIDVFKANIYYGHLHDFQEANQTSVEGQMEASCLACLCRLDAKFLKGKPNNWQHGHTCFEFFPDGSYNWYKIKIINGRTAYNGVVFDGNCDRK